jgi:PGDYG protein
VSPEPVPLFRSRMERGHSTLISADPRCIHARKLEREIDVRFTDVACTVQTQEGVVHARPGDAIITGTAGEHWRVSRARFAEKYRPAPSTRAGESGRYISLPNRILAVPMSEAFEVLLVDGVSRLTGRPGEWLVDYGDGSLGIVSPSIFATTYQIIDHMGKHRLSQGMALHQFIQWLLLLGAHIDTLPPPPVPQAPPALSPLIDAIAGAHTRFDEHALHFGHRYRSGFWAIYLLSAVAVLFAVMPLALGWDSAFHALHPYAGLWALGEVCVIGAVSAIYWRGHRGHWQAEWLGARTTAELSWYLPMLAPLLDLSAPATEPNWYLRVFDPGQHLRGSDDVARLCADYEPLARRQLATAWSDPEFIAGYAAWTMDILEQQRHYHYRIASKQHALQHRVHSVNIVLFAVTAIGALTHLVVHSMWLTLVTMFFPALGGSLHGALAQSEAYRLETTSARLVGELQGAIGRIRATLDQTGVARDIKALKAAIEAAIALILEEHQDWHLLVRPHKLPLA